MPRNKGEKIPVVLGAPLPEDVVSSDGSIVLAKQGVIVTKTMLDRLSNWIFEEEPGLAPDPEPRKKLRKSMRDAVLKRLEFQDIVSVKTRNELEKGMTSFFEDEGRGGVAALEESISKLVSETPDNPDVPLKLFTLKQHSSFVYSHSLECSILASFLATNLNYSRQEVSAFSMAMMVHDIGVLSIPAEILDKTQPLTPEDWQLIHAHPRNGWDILKALPGIDPLALLVCIGHHLRADGKGYPVEVDYESMPPLVHLSALINHFESLTSPRPFRPAYPLHAAIKIILNQRERYHPSALESFISIVGIYPISTFLQLDTAEIGVVVRNNPDNLFLPEIKLVLDPAGKMYSKEIVVNLLEEPKLNIIRVVDKI